MTRDDVIRMAREAGFRAGHIELYNSDPMPFIAPCSATNCMPELVRFAAIVAAAERDALRAKNEAMEQQEPAGYGVLYVEPANGEEDWDSIWKHRVFAEDHVKDFVQAYSDSGESVGAITVVPLYALPGAKGE